jgi:UDPglucose 6-dehydrogenase
MEGFERRVVSSEGEIGEIQGTNSEMKEKGMSDGSNAPGRVAVIGLGKLGAPMAASIAARGVPVIGVDLDPAKVDLINRGKPPVAETGLAETILRGRERLQATVSIVEAVAAAEMIFVIVPTPSEPGGFFSLQYVLEACRKIGRALKKKGGFPVVVITATVMPGSTGGAIRETLEKHSGKKAGKHFGLCYSPEFIALGSVIRDFLNPDFILVGESDSRSGSKLHAFYRAVCENDPYIAHMNHVNAELSKLAVNTFITTKITYANMLAHLCERLPGADVDTVTKAIGRDTRIGGKYLKGAAGYGGPCFPRDNLALGALARGLGVGAGLAEATDRENREEVERLARHVMLFARRGTAVGILGLSYKPDTDVVEESQGILLAKRLKESGLELTVYDPAAMDCARLELGGNLAYARSAEECIRRSDVIVVATPWKEFASLEARAFSRRRPRAVLIDAWRIIPEECRKVTVYIPIGVSRKGGK